MVIGIISEYNPFHNGHLYQINKIREEFGENTNIVAVMSGNYVQRGGIAIADKALRAKSAVLCGINLVLELPFPFSMSSAEFFAKSAVSILNSLGCVDVISFGSENGDIDFLTTVANAMLSDEYNTAVKNMGCMDEYANLGHPRICELALRQVMGEEVKFEFSPNNILAIEYIKALITLDSKIAPHTIKRQGGGFSDENFVMGNIQSATAIRNSISHKDITALEYVPDITKNEILNSIKSGDFPCDGEKLSSAIISSFRLNSLLDDHDILDAGGGLYNRLRDTSFEANNIEDMVSSAESKKFTKARIRRAIFNTYLSVTSSQIKELPAYTQILAFDSNGRGILKSIKKHSKIPILTKPSDMWRLDDMGKRQKAISDRADSVFQMTKPIPKEGNFALRFTPFVKE